MKFLLLPLLLTAGWFGLNASAADDAAPACTPEDCRITVECTARDTCLVTCYDADDEIVCQREVPCDTPCEKACEQPCETPGAAAAAAEPARASCEPTACSR